MCSRGGASWAWALACCSAWMQSRKACKSRVRRWEPGHRRRRSAGRLDEVEAGGVGRSPTTQNWQRIDTRRPSSPWSLAAVRQRRRANFRCAAAGRSPSDSDSRSQGLG
nr:unnamed protein product [Digitaria exilis]